MKRNFLTGVATAVTALLVGATVAQAASVEWGGMLRPRFEYNEHSNFNAATSTANGGTQSSGDYFISSLIRLNAKVDILPDTSAFIQLQSTRTWGNDLAGVAGNQNSPGQGFGGSGNAAFTANDNDTSVGVHQAYFTLKNFATLPIDLKVGRQEVILDGWRLFGNTIWTQGMQSHDAVTVSHAHDNLTVAYVYSTGNEGAPAVGTGTINDNEDVDVHALYAQMKGILGGAASFYFVGVNDKCSFSAATAACTNGVSSATSGGAVDNTYYTVGGRQAGQLFGIDYRGEFYYQFGDAEGAANAANATGGVGTPYGGALGLSGALLGTDRSAYMFGVRVGKKFNSVMWKPSLTLWYDYLSGTSDQDARDGNYKSFNTLFDTGHKFYGLQDLFLGIGAGSNNYLGLIDYAIKSTIQPAKGWKIATAYHYFTTAESVVANTNFSGSTTNGGTGGDTNALGNELDVTIIHKYNSNTTITAGYSRFWQESAFELLNAGASSLSTVTPADWAYLMFTVKF